jgi:hypothetical protein
MFSGVEDDITNFIVDALKAADVLHLPSDFIMPDLADTANLPIYAPLAEYMETLLDVHPDELELTVQNLIDLYLGADRAEEEETTVGPGTTACELCERPMPLTIHHLYPREEHDRLLRRQGSTLTRYDLLVVHRAWLCRPCHSSVHRLIPNRTLADEYYSVSKLLDHEGVRKWVGYAAKQRVSGRDHQKLGLRYRR